MNHLSKSYDCDQVFEAPCANDCKSHLYCCPRCIHSLSCAQNLLVVMMYSLPSRLLRYKLTKERFAWLSDKLDPFIGPKAGGTGVVHRHACSTNIKLSITLRYLAGGDPTDIQDLHGCKKSTMFKHLWSKFWPHDALPCQVCVTARS